MSTQTSNGAVGRRELHAELSALCNDLRAEIQGVRAEIQTLRPEIYQALASQTRSNIATIAGALTAQTAIFAAINYLMLKH